jgi:hypothetical protein
MQRSWGPWFGVAVLVGGCAAAAVVGVVMAAGPPGRQKSSLFCSMTSSTSFARYYVQLFNPTQPPGMCKDANRTFTEQEFHAIPGLKRQCILDRDDQIEQQHGIVSVFSDESELSIVAARLACRDAGNL